MRLALYDGQSAVPSTVIEWLSPDEAEAVVCFIDQWRLLVKNGGHGCIEVVMKDTVAMEFRTTHKKRLRSEARV